MTSIGGADFTAYHSTPEGSKLLGRSFLEKDGEQGPCEFEMFDVQQGQDVYLPFPRDRKEEILHITLTDPHNKSPKKEVFALKRVP